MALDGFLYSMAYANSPVLQKIREYQYYIFIGSMIILAGGTYYMMKNSKIDEEQEL